MKIANVICRIVVGILFIIFGLNGLFHFLPQPPFPEGSPDAQFIGVMTLSHWMGLIGFFQVLGGVLVHIGRTAPLGLCILAPILVNILSFHALLLNGEGIVLGLILSVLEIFLIYAYRAYFSGIFSVNASPS